MNADTLTLSAAKRIQHEELYFCVARPSASDIGYCGASNGYVYAIDFAADEPEPESLPVAGHQSYVTGAAACDNMLITGSYDRHLVWWNLDCREIVRSFQAHEKWIRKVVASPDGFHVASVADDMRCRVWNAATGELVHDLAGHEPETPHHFPSMFFTCCFSNGGDFLATADKVGHVCIWDVQSGKLQKTLDSPEHYTWDPVQRRHSIGGIRSLAFSPDDRLLAVGGIGHIGNIDHLGGNSLVHLFDWRSGERSHKFENDKHKGLIQRLHFRQDGRQVLAGGGGNEGFLLLIDLDTEEFIADDKAPMHVHDFEVNESESRLYAVGHGSSGVWEMG